MCDDHTEADIAKFVAAGGAANRREFGLLAGAVGVAGVAGLGMMWPGALDAKRAAKIKQSDVLVKTPDGVADCHFAAPARGRHPGIIVWPDIFGLRPAFRQMGAELAAAGYAVLTVNPFYRTVKSPVLPEGVDMRSPENFGKVREHASKLTPQTNVTDAAAFVAFLDAQKSVDTKRGIGTTGYCMGGPMVMRSAAALPDRVRAGASFHGSRTATDAPESPHLLVPQMKAQFLFAVAENDDQKNPAEKELLKAAFAAANLPAEIEVYPGTLHGWCPPGSPAHNPEQAARAFARTLELFKRAL